MSSRTRAIALLATICTTACAGARAATRPAPAPTRARIAPTTTTAAERGIAAGFVDGVAPPRLVTSGHDYRTILRSLLEYSNWIVGHDVDTALVTRVAAPGSPWDRGLHAQIASLRRERLHYREQYAGASTITLVSTLRDVVSARYVQPITRQAWLDARGYTRHEIRPSAPTTSYVVVMALVAPGSWRLVSVDQR